MNRLRLLELRSKEVAEFRNLTMIPSNEHEVLDSAFTVYEKRLRAKESLQTVSPDKKMRGERYSVATE